MARWAWVMGGFGLGVASDRVRGASSDQRTGERLRDAFARMGGTGVKIGQQLSVRLDLLPQAVCSELAKLTDAAPPIDFEDAQHVLDAACGGDWRTRFADVQRQPIGAASIACVYRATLLDGSDVAIKIQRPGVGERFACDLYALRVATRLAEATTAVRPNFFRFFRSEVESMYLEELDFTIEARFTTLFRQLVKRDKIEFATAPRVYTELSSTDVLVTEFVKAVSCGELLRAHEAGDEARLAEYAEMGIDPAQVGTNVMILSLWARGETHIFHADPHPANLLVLPDNKLCVLDFGSCGTTHTRARTVQQEMTGRVLATDVDGIVNAAFLDVQPLPRVDIEDVRRDMRTEFNYWLIAGLDKHAPWWEKTSAGLWLGMVKATQKYQIPLNVDTLRTLRGTLLYDTLVFRLNPKFSAKETRQSINDGWRRQARRHAGQRSRGVAPWLERARSLRRGTLAAGLRFEQLSAQVQVSVGRVAEASQLLLRVGERALWLTLALGTLELALQPGITVERARQVLTSTPGLIALTTLAVWWVRRLLPRLEERR